ncbi:MAG: hypothetical protein Q7S83_01665 [bacterium]|nr:hypothetical protein [bacterium]
MSTVDRGRSLFEEFLILSANASLLRMKKLAEEERPNSATGFHAAVMPIWKEAQANLFALLQITKPRFGITEIESVFFRLVAELNGILPMDYPFALALATFTGEDPRRLIISVIRRKMIPGLHDCLNPKLAIRMAAQTKEEFDQNLGRTISFYRFPEEQEEFI